MATQNLSAPAAEGNTPIPLYLSEGGGMADIDSLRRNLEAIADSLRDLAQGITNHAIDLESMMPAQAPEARS